MGGDGDASQSRVSGTTREKYVISIGAKKHVLGTWRRRIPVSPRDAESNIRGLRFIEMYRGDATDQSILSKCFQISFRFMGTHTDPTLSRRNG